MLERYRAKEETSLRTTRVGLARIGTMSKSKGKKKTEDEEAFDKTFKDIDWKLIRVVQRFQKEKDDNYELGDASLLSEEFLSKSFYAQVQIA